MAEKDRRIDILLLASVAALQVTAPSGSVPSDAALPVIALVPPSAPIAPAAPAAATPETVDRPAAPPAANPPAPSKPKSAEAPSAEHEVVVTGRSRKGDPLVEINAETFGAAQSVDKALIGPVALAYKKAVPSPFRKGLRNFLANLREPVVAVNYVLQLKPGKAAETVGRFAINTTVGVAGLIDVAKRKGINLPHRRNGFANTLGFYGVKPGPFFFLPLIGPITLRDLIGNGIDQVLVPIGTVKPFNQVEYTVPVAVLSALDYRAEFDGELERQRTTVDPYAASRKYYLDRRQAEIDALRGRLPPGAPDPSLRPKGKAQ
ncbi:MAG: VacJ family lipoprotein [Pseudomonadota bacterium]